MKFKEIIKNARKKLEVPAAPAMPCERTIASSGQPEARMMITIQNVRVSWKQRNPRDCVWKELYSKVTKTIWQEKGAIDSQHESNLVHKLIPIPQAMKILAGKQQWTKKKKT